jgi:colanic acid biosynthesis glycosyl transferase WcaI
MTAVVAVPHYPTGQVPQGYQGYWARRSFERGVKVIRIPVPSVNRAKLLQRFFQFLVFQVRATWVGISCSYDVALFSNPALSTGLPLLILSALRRKAAVYSIHDVYPEVGVTLGVFRNPLVVKIVKAWEQSCLHRAKYVRILSESFAPSIRRLGVSNSKLVLIYDWVDTDLVRPLPRGNAFAEEHGLIDPFVVLYAGNIGLSQGLEHVLYAADELKDRPDIRFVFVGDGAARAQLVGLADERRLTNVQFVPFQPRERLPDVLASADVSLVVLRKGIGSSSLPSKSFSILASGRPLIASVDEDSDVARLVQRAGAGLVVPPEAANCLTEAILTLKNDTGLRRRMGERGRDFVLANHSPMAAAEQFEGLLSRCVTSPARKPAQKVRG